MKSSIAVVPFLLGLYAVAGVDEDASPFSALTEAERLELEAARITWPSLELDEEHPHTVFGEPMHAQADDQHQMLRSYHGFSVLYDDRILAPRWTCIKVTSAMADAHPEVGRESRFSRDQVLLDAGLQVATHDDYNNPAGSRDWARGHLVQFDDARGWGAQAGKESFLTSNIAPQLQAHNSAGWLTLEETCTEFARDFGVVWIYSGPIYDDHPQPFAPSRTVPAPRSFYKVLISPGENGSVDVLAFIMPHEPIERSVDLGQFLVSIDQVELETDLDFLHELPDVVEDVLESIVWEMWPDA